MVLEKEEPYFGQLCLFSSSASLASRPVLYRIPVCPSFINFSFLLLLEGVRNTKFSLWLEIARDSGRVSRQAAGEVNFSVYSAAPDASGGRITETVLAYYVVPCKLAWLSEP